MGKIKNKWMDAQEEQVQEQIDPTEWDMAFPDNVVDYVDRIAEDHDSYVNQPQVFDW
tara:strand:+ start:2039 stop:2209 length:171 start_codon:yes stop_codon:yes gene_type:complete